MNRCAFFLIILVAGACRQADSTRLNFINYGVETVGDLPINTGSRFNVWYLNEAGITDSLMDTHRFSHSFTIEGEGVSWLRAASLDSIPLRLSISHNGKLAGSETGNEVEMRVPFK